MKQQDIATGVKVNATCFFWQITDRLAVSTFSTYPALRNTYLPYETAFTKSCCVSVCDLQVTS